VRILRATETRAALAMADAIASMRMAFGSDTEAPLRQLVGQSLVMPGRVGDIAGVKVVSTVPGNPTGIVIVLDVDGSPVGIADGPTITSIRTAAGAALATDLLAPADATSMAMIGAGAMARDQIAAVHEVRTMNRIVVWSRDESKAHALAEEFGGETAPTPAEAVHGVDIVTTATPSTLPLFDDDDLQRLVHINAIGAFTPDMAEIPAEFVRQAFIVVDDITAAAVEAGDLIQAGCTPDTDMCDLLGMASIPVHDRTFFKSVGIATQDVAAAATALSNAERMGLGVVVDR
jgi:ornithine cyclodeaminase/alanine dehydrogenase-like protein (mu-crystallin family)